MDQGAEDAMLDAFAQEGQRQHSQDRQIAELSERVARLERLVETLRNLVALPPHTEAA